MRTGLGGIRRLVAAGKPWRRRVLRLLALWLLFALAAAALGVSPNVPRLAGVFLAGAAIAWYVVDHAASNSVAVWPLTDSHLSGGGRGSDFRVTNLARRLEAANTRGEGRADLVHDLHALLCTTIRERLYAKHGIVIEEEPAWAEGVMPTQLWDFLVTLPPTDVYTPARLDPILRRIEQW